MAPEDPAHTKVKPALVTAVSTASSSSATYIHYIRRQKAGVPFFPRLLAARVNRATGATKRKSNGLRAISRRI